jgi:HPt (histidine-containing phosphotransfer) domain-containing protein
MSDAPHVQHVEYDAAAPIMERGQIDMLLMGDESEDETNLLIREIFAIYQTEAVEKLSELDQICRNRDGEALRKLVHFIAGSAGNLGMMRLCAFYRGIERAINAGVLEDYEACAKLIPREYDLGCEQFTRTLDLD